MAALIAIGCSKPAPPERTAPAPAIESAPAASKQTAEPCAPCDRSGAPAFTFGGNYLDPSCTQPVVHADVVPCAPIVASGNTMVAYAQPVARHKAGERATTHLIRQTTASEVARLFHKLDGRCTAFPAIGFKVAPDGCDGKKICRNATGDLACGTCRLLNDGCPDYVATRVFALVSN